MSSYDLRVQTQQTNSERLINELILAPGIIEIRLLAQGYKT